MKPATAIFSLADAIRPYWLSGINDISGLQTEGLREWFASGQFFIDGATAEGAFVAAAVDRDALSKRFAGDINRFAVASFESSHHVVRNGTFPKATAWLLISAYYSAFFAAHALLRVLGVSCSQLDKRRVDVVNETADAQGFLGVPVKRGSFGCIFDYSSGRLSCERLGSTGGGAHELLWSLFNTEIEQLRFKILVSPTQTAEQNRLAFGKLSDIKAVLTRDGLSNGSWLSHVRNRINYSHELDSWFPYRATRQLYDRLFRIHAQWRAEPEGIVLGSREPLACHLEACAFLTSLCRQVTADISQRCSGGDSFLMSGAERFLRLAKVF